MIDVWVVRNRHGDMVHIQPGKPYTQPDGWTATRETLLTPEMAAVIAAAKAMVDVIAPPKDSNYQEYQAAAGELYVRVGVLRALEGDA